MKILVIDDEKSILNLIKMNLKLEGYEIIVSMNGIEGIEKFKKEKPDLVILDIMLPDISGHEVIQKFQEVNNDIPVIMVTAKSQINDKLLGLQLGADDYITKPFNSTELILRIKAITKRITKKDREEVHKNNEINLGAIKVLKNERKVLVDGKEVNMTYKEFNTLLLMIENHNKVFTRDELLEKVWGYEYEGNSRAVDILIQRLRKKLSPYSQSVKTIYGVGYKLEI
ncbi:XRE family transcriptional regulator [Clostridium carboxidivorans P7]|uniref:Stage 0 sporulation protein A homolog n=1 Tax=Clostridium carboxidivorans P7 TaxID=536227 RepID=C6PZA4_9CLOT|nr:response regulator transcription factor [Clostridium carboxidivorans]AKN33525.1 XRE family transcriptional regulator [Clostridium carboxidivorans P7]EET85421.1 two component transcriptional regulator, winged helix family [Clostridium carboxidivorans P7]EFG86895.1 response regulator receiver domain protein [Clostridium carboxidivorans P7]